MTARQAVVICLAMYFGNLLFAAFADGEYDIATSRSYFQAWAVFACWLVSRKKR